MLMAKPETTTRWSDRLKATADSYRGISPPPVEGVLTRMVGLTLEAVGCQAAIGSRCYVVSPSGARVETEVVGFSGDKLFLMPIEDVHGLVPNSRVIPDEEVYRVKVSDRLLGRVLDGRGKPLDGKPGITGGTHMPLQGRPVNPLLRRPVTETMDVGIRAMNALFSVGRGQRLGLFAGSGVGKSVLLGMMTRFTSADVVVVGLIGERGREVKEFVQDILGPEGLARAVVVAAPADTSPMMRLHGAMLAHSIAEHFRDQGKQVLLLMDSLTRFAQAQREIALAIGELPATKGYPPSVFTMLPQLVERTGNGDERGGSITAFYTVLVEGDDHNEPIADSARAILDGHISLSRELAESGHFPAIDVEASISRVMPSVTSTEHQLMARKFRQFFSTYQQNRDLINVGAYQQGANSVVDEAIARFPELVEFLRQEINESVSSKQSFEQLIALMSQEVPEKVPEVVEIE